MQGEPSRTRGPALSADPTTGHRFSAAAGMPDGGKGDPRATPLFHSSDSRQPAVHNLEPDGKLRRQLGAVRDDDQDILLAVV